MEITNFKEEIYEQAFGDNAINRDFSEEEVIAEIKRQCNSDLDDFLETMEGYNESQGDDLEEEDWTFVERLKSEIENYKISRGF